MTRRVEFDIGDMQPWVPTVPQVREAVFRFDFFGPDFSRLLPPDSIGRKLKVTQDELERIAENTYEAFLSGRVLDFGMLPNAVIKSTSHRAGGLWNDGHIGFPFRDPYVVFHTWDAPQQGGSAAAAYLVAPLAGPLGPCEMFELQPSKIRGVGRLMIGDRGMFMRQAGKKTQGSHIAPFMLRFIPDAPDYVNNGETPQEAACSNIGDPLLCTMMILNTRGIERSTITVADKLNRARRKNGKLPIPPYDTINSEPYVTAVLARGASRPRGEDQGGHHASPVMHLRMGHPRTYATGNSIFVRDALVNATPEAKAAFRSHYKVAASAAD